MNRGNPNSSPGGATRAPNKTARFAAAAAARCMAVATCYAAGVSSEGPQRHSADALEMGHAGLSETLRLLGMTEARLHEFRDGVPLGPDEVDLLPRMLITVSRFPPIELERGA